MICPHCQKFVNVKKILCVSCGKPTLHESRMEVYENIRGRKRISGHICKMCYQRIVNNDGVG